MAGFGKGGMSYKPPKLGVVRSSGAGKEMRAVMPRSAGSKDTNYVAGFNPRKGRYTMSTGTNPKVPDPPRFQDTAPFKHDAPTGGKFNLEGFDDTV